MSIFKQKRQTARKALIYYLEVYDSDSRKLIGRVVDITTGGFQMISEEQAEAGKAYQLKIQLPEEIQGVAEIQFDTRCVRSVRDHHSKYYYSGFKFREISPDQSSIIGKLISQFEF